MEGVDGHLGESGLGFLGGEPINGGGGMAATVTLACVLNLGEVRLGKSGLGVRWHGGESIVR